MNEYYFDIETSGLDLWKEQVVAVAYQPIVSGAPADDLTILKAWDRGGEERVLRQVLKLGVFEADRDNAFAFVPIGTNLLFDLTFLIARMDRLGIRKWKPREVLHFFHNKPTKDIKHVLVLMNEGRFKGSSLDAFSTKKRTGGAAVVDMWRRKDYKGIEEYIREDAEAFFEIYVKIVPSLSELGRKFSHAGKPQ